MILADIRAVGKRDGLNSLEQVSACALYTRQMINYSILLQVKAITLSSELFSVENDLVTPTFKLKRPALKSKFMQDMDNMYSKLPA